MNMILLWAIITFAVAFKVKELNRWTVGLYAALCVGNILFQYLSF
jgi:hypothetical protein